MTPDPHTHREAGFVLLREILRTRYAGASAPQAPLREGGLQGGELPRFLDNAIDTYNEKAFREAKVGRVEGVPRGRREGREGRDGSVENQRFADYLAARLGDEKNPAWYSLVVRTAPREVVQDALRRALDVPTREIRRSRAALFTSIVRPHVPRRRRSP